MDIGHWSFVDPFGDCSVRTENGLEIHAPCGGELWKINRSAPRVLHSVPGDFALQALCGPVTAEKPARGGIVLWKDEHNFLCLERGLYGPREITLWGCLEVNGRAQEVFSGRGRLPASRLFLRLERKGDRIAGLCGADGENWFRVGQAVFSVADPLEVGLFAAGTIHASEAYHAVFPNGTAIRFEAIRLWG